MLDIGSILKERLEAYKQNPTTYEKDRGKEYSKKWNYGVQCFVDRINKDNKKENRPEAKFIAVRMRLVALEEVDDLRWFYGVCQKYSTTYQKKLVDGKPVRNTFKRCFYGATKC